MKEEVKDGGAAIQCPSCGETLAPAVRFCGVCGVPMVATDVDGAAASRRPAGKGRKAAWPRSMASGTLAAVQDPFVGKVLADRFVIEKRLGEGGFGAVYQGRQIGSGRQVALKLLHPDMADDENLVARFRREGVLLCNLKDAHTVTTYDFDQAADGTLFIAMELLQGKSLSQVLDEESHIAWQRLFRILAQASAALGEAHAQGIVHRDLKPGNIFLERRPGQPEFVKLLDFGIAKLIASDQQRAAKLTALGQTLGTLEYMSPEQLMGKALDGRSDIYALGVLSYELLTGRLPFPEAKAPAELITAQLRRIPAPPSQVRPDADIPPRVDAIVLKMLAKDKDQRFATMAELSGAVCDALEDPGHPREAGPPSPAIDQSPECDGAATKGKTRPQPSDRQKRSDRPAERAKAEAPSTVAAMAAAGLGKSRMGLWLVVAVIAIGAGVGLWWTLG